MLQAFEFDGRACSLMLWAVSTLGLRPPAEWLEMMLVAAFEGGLADYGPQVCVCEPLVCWVCRWKEEGGVQVSGPGVQVREPVQWR